MFFNILFAKIIKNGKRKAENGKLFQQPLFPKLIANKRWHSMTFGLSALNGKRTLATAEWQVREGDY